MTLNENIVKISADLIPLIKWLYEAGIIRVDGSTSTVHVTEEFFRETFPVYEVHNRGRDEYKYELSYTYNGIVFYCLSPEK